MKKSITRALTIGLSLTCILGFVGYQKAKEEQSHANEATARTSNVANVATEPESPNEVFQFLLDKYDLMFMLWGPEGHDLYAYYIYPDYAEWECHILMPANTDDMEQYQKNLSWKMEDDNLIVTSVGGEWQETLVVDITEETATSKTNGRVYKIYAIEPNGEAEPTAAHTLDSKSLQEPTTQTAAIGNPWLQWDSLEDAEAEVGFSFGLPEVIADHYTAEAYRTLNRELLEVIYRDGDFEVRVRKQKGEGQDISGDYTQYDTCTESPFGDGKITNYHSSGSNAIKQVISCGGYSWSLAAPNGYWGDSNADFLNPILEG